MHYSIEQTPQLTTYLISTGDADQSARQFSGDQDYKSLAAPTRRPLIDRVLRGLFVGFCLAFGIAFGIFIYAIVFDMRGLIEVTSLRLTQLGLALMFNLAALFVRD